MKNVVASTPASPECCAFTFTKSLKRNSLSREPSTYAPFCIIRPWSLFTAAATSSLASAPRFNSLAYTSLRISLEGPLVNLMIRSGASMAATNSGTFSRKALISSRGLNPTKPMKAVSGLSTSACPTVALPSSGYLARVMQSGSPIATAISGLWSASTEAFGSDWCSCSAKALSGCTCRGRAFRMDRTLKR